jgi:phosphoglycerate dehydrogenase-like enzyme
MKLKAHYASDPKPEVLKILTSNLAAAPPFLELENVVMNPHRSGASLETESLRMQHLAKLFS